MKKLKTFAVQRPFLFAIVLVFVYALLTTLVFPVHYLFPDTEIGQTYGDALSKLIVFAIFLLALWRFDWFRASGITRTGGRWIWVLAAVITTYRILTELYAFTGSASLPITGGALAAARLTFSLSTALVEETMLRGLVLMAMLAAWGGSKQGQVRAVLLSAVVFGLTHLFNLISRPPGVVLFQTVMVMLPGILYAALVLYTRSLWPGIIIHWLGNAAVNIKLIGSESYQETFSMWLIYAVTLLPLVAYSAYLLWKLPEDEPQRRTAEAAA